MLVFLFLSPLRILLIIFIVMGEKVGLVSSIELCFPSVFQNILFKIKSPWREAIELHALWLLLVSLENQGKNLSLVIVFGFWQDCFFGKPLSFNHVCRSGASQLLKCGSPIAYHLLTDAYLAAVVHLTVHAWYFKEMLGIFWIMVSTEWILKVAMKLVSRSHLNISIVFELKMYMVCSFPNHSAELNILKHGHKMSLMFNICP